MRKLIFLIMLLLMMVLPVRAYDTTTYLLNKSYIGSGNVAFDPLYQVVDLVSATAGTATASKALILGPAKDVDSLVITSNLKILESTGATYTTTIQGGNQSANLILTLPTAYAGATGYVLSSTDEGVLSWVANAGTFTGGTILNDIDMTDGKYIRSSTTTAEGTALQVYDLTAVASYTNVLSWTNGDDPAIVLGAATNSLAIVSSGLNVTTAGAVTGVTNLTASGTVTAASASFTTLYKTAVVAAAAGDVALTIDAAGSGNITIAGTSTGNTIFARAVLMNGNVDIGNAPSDTLTITSIIDGDVTLYDGTTDSPSLILKDAGGETVTFVKANGGNAICTPGAATESFQILTGNLKVGNGSEDVTLNGNDAYVTGTFEVDGTTRFDADMALNDQLLATMGDNTEEVIITTAVTNYAADSAIVAITSTGNGATNNTYLLRMQNTADADAQDHFFVCEDNAGNDKLAVNSGGTITSTLDAASSVKIDAATTINTTTGGILDLDVTSATNTNKGISIDYELDDGATQAYGIYIDVDDDGAGGNETFDAIYIGNSAGTDATIRGLVLANTLDDGIVATVGAAGQVMVVDAEATINTTTAGIFDIAAILSENGASVINIQVESEADGASEVVSGIFVEMDDDADNATNEVRGIHVAGDGTNGTGLQHAIVVTGANIDAGLYLQTGYLRVGTGSTPDMALGAADNAFIEGTLEVDGAVRIDGSITGDGGDALGGYLRTVTNDTNGTDLAASESGTVQVGKGAGVWNLPEASTCIGAWYTIVVGTAANIDINPADADQILILTDAVGNAIRSATVGNTVTLLAIDETNWVVIGIEGTWADVN